MAPKTIDKGFLIILDVGINTAADKKENDGKSFFEKARNFTARLIERKIFGLSTDYIGIILLGSEETNNNLDIVCDGGYKHINLHTELKSPTWQMISDLPETPSKSKGDWFNALLVAEDHFTNGVNGVKIVNKKVILVTNFKVPTHQEKEKLEKVLMGFRDTKFVVDVIGINIKEGNYKNEDLNLAKQFVEHTSGTNANFDSAMGYLQFHRKKKISSKRWDVNLIIGHEHIDCDHSGHDHDCVRPNISIPVTGYNRLDPKAELCNLIESDNKNKRNKLKHKTKSRCTTESVENKNHQINHQSQTRDGSSNTIEAYIYGQEPIPITDIQSMFYKSGPECLSVYGFTDASNIKWHCLNGSGLSYIFGRKGDPNAQYAFHCFVECLHELGLVGIVRRVHIDKTAMYLLMPVFDVSDYVCLSMVRLCYKEEINNMPFPPTNLKKHNCSDEQVNAFKDLVKAMDLTKAYDNTFDDEEAFRVGESVSPAAQYMFDCIAYRAMNPGKPLPQPRDEIMNLFNVPPLVEKRSRDALGKIKELFTLKVVEAPKKSQRKTVSDQQQPSTSVQRNDTTGDAVPKVELPATKPNVPIINKISTIDPISDFKSLASKGKTLIELSPQMTDAIENLVYCNLDGNYTKPFDAMMYFRAECVKTDPISYNTWLQKFRAELIDRDRCDIINLITAKKVNLILRHENELSAYDTENIYEENQLYEKDTVPDSIELTISNEVNDLFDEM